MSDDNSDKVADILRAIVNTNQTVANIINIIQQKKRTASQYDADQQPQQPLPQLSPPKKAKQKQKQLSSKQLINQYVNSGGKKNQRKQRKQNNSDSEDSDDVKQQQQPESQPDTNKRVRRAPARYRPANYDNTESGDTAHAKTNKINETNDGDGDFTTGDEMLWMVSASKSTRVHRRYDCRGAKLQVTAEEAHALGLRECIWCKKSERL